LLERAFKNKRIGHYLFWNMKAEIDCPESSLRFGLILESYLRGCPNHLKELQRQVRFHSHDLFPESHGE